MLAKSDQEEELEREGDNGENVLKEKVETENACLQLAMCVKAIL